MHYNNTNGGAGEVLEIKIAELANAYFKKEISLSPFRKAITSELSGNVEYAPLLAAVSSLRRNDVFQCIQTMAKSSLILNERLETNLL